MAAVPLRVAVDGCPSGGIVHVVRQEGVCQGQKMCSQFTSWDSPEKYWVIYILRAYLMLRVIALGQGDPRNRFFVPRHGRFLLLQCNFQFEDTTS